MKLFVVNPSKLKYVDDQFKTQEMCEYVVERVPDLIEYVPDKFKTQEDV